MKVSELIELLESFREELRDHRKLWGASLAQPIPQYPVRNRKALEEQSDLLARQLGRLRPYLDRFRDSWMMRHPATGVTWDVLDAAVSLQAVAPMKGPSIGSAIEAIDQILGQIEGLDRDDDIPADWGRPIRAGASADRVALGYLPHLHPFIHEGCSRLFQDGHYVQAIEESAKAVLQYLRDKTGLALDGTALARPPSASRIQFLRSVTFPMRAARMNNWVSWSFSRVWPRESAIPWRTPTGAGRSSRRRSSIL